MDDPNKESGSRATAGGDDPMAAYSRSMTMAAEPDDRDDFFPLPLTP